MGMLIGYIRVSSEGQNIARQMEKMESLGIPAESIYIDRASGKDMERPEWKRLMADVKRGDTVIVDSLDRLGRNYEAVTGEWRRLTRDMGVDIKALDLEFMDSSAFRGMGDVGTLMEDMVLNLLAWVAQTERQKIRQRQAEGIAIAKAEGKYEGRKKAELDSDAAAFVVAGLEDGSIDVKSAAEILGTSVRSIYRMRKDGRLSVA